MDLHLSRHKVDVPFLIMGMLFLAQAIAEYFLPEVLEGDRLEIKLICGARIIVALFTLLFCARAQGLFHPIHVAFLLMLFWLCCAGIIQTDEMMPMLYASVMFLHWYSIFLFCFVRVQANPSRCGIFLIIVFGSLFVWLAALINCVKIAMDISGRSFEFQIQNYLSYYMLGLLPYVLLLRSNKIKVIAIFLISLGVVYSLKRGAMLALVLMGFGSSVLYLIFLDKGERQKRKLLILLFAWFLGLGVFGLFYRINPVALERRFNSETGRAPIFSATISNIKKSDVFELLVGHGCMASTKDVGERTHNDWLFLLYDYGIIGLLLMLNVYFALFSLLRQLCRRQSRLALSLMSSIILMACVQIYSIGLYLKIFGFITGSIGLVAGINCHNAVLRSRLRGMVLT